MKKYFNRAAYELVDLYDEKLVGIFYEEELTLVYKNENTVFLINEILKTKKIKNTTWKLVNWIGYNKNKTDWIKADDIVDVEKL